MDQKENMCPSMLLQVRAHSTVHSPTVSGLAAVDSAPEQLTNLELQAVAVHKKKTIKKPSVFSLSTVLMHAYVCKTSYLCIFSAQLSHQVH